MPDFATLSCPTCGGQLQITQNIDRFACAHCGNEHVVNRGGGIVSLAPVVAGLDGIRRGTDRTAAELAIRRLKKETGETEKEAMALAYSLLANDGKGVVSELKKLVKWGPHLRGKSVSDRLEELRMYDQETIAGLSTDALEDFSQS